MGGAVDEADPLNSNDVEVSEETAGPKQRVTRDTIEWTHDVLGVPYNQIADILGVDRGTVRRWRELQTTPTRDHYRRMEDLREIKYLTNQVFEDPDQIQEWLHEPSNMLRGRTPWSYLERGEFEPLIEALSSVAGGAFM